MLASISAASVVAAADGQAEVSVAVLRDVARRQGSTSLQGTALRVAPRATLKDLELTDTTRAAIDELIAWARHREALLAEGSLAGKGSKGRGLTALFAGSSGTGKTLAAEAVAGELGLDLYTVELATIIDKYIGETEKNLERVIREAESLNVVLFFDEADALFGSRSEVKDARDRYANQEVSYLLQRIERFDGIAVLATNLRGNIDPAFSRRLHHVITFLDPDAPTRRRLWAAHLEAVSALDVADEPDLDWLAGHVEVTGGSIRNIVMASAFAAASQDSAVGMRHLVAAVQREYQKLGRRMDRDKSPQRIPVIAPQ
jgi:SpoVK/Ycf46/Vps4 family AAA+-type ATPase